MANEINVDVFPRHLKMELGVEDAQDAVKVLKEIGTATGALLSIDAAGFGLPVFQMLKETGVDCQAVAYNDSERIERGDLRD